MATCGKRCYSCSCSYNWFGIHAVDWAAILLLLLLFLVKVFLRVWVIRTEGCRVKSGCVFCAGTIGKYAESREDKQEDEERNDE